ncbi:MAG: glutamine synthetase [Alphaproteobacteria bacterium]
MNFDTSAPAEAKIYPESIVEALPGPERVAEAKAKLEEAGVKYVLSCWIDLLGIPKTKPVPVREFQALCAGKGPQFAVHSVSMVPELGPADSDQIPIPDLDSLLICPWDTSTAWVFADLYWEDKPYNLCPRLALKRQLAKALEAGLRPMAGVEPEFIAMRYDEGGNPVKAFDEDPALAGGAPARRQAWGYDAEASIDSRAFLGELIDILEALEWELHDVVAEGAYSQFELDFGYTDVLAMADRYTFLRVLLKEVAKKHGMFITFMPKPTTGDWRSGAHINLSLADAETGANLFEDGQGGWSDTVYKVLGGLLRHGGALTAITCSTVNSYKGLVSKVPGFEGGVYTWAPTHFSYGMNNRSAMLRLPQNRFCIENRATDMCMNGYLGMAMTTAAAVKGVTENLDPGPALNKDLYAITPEEFDEKGIQRLPRNLLEAIEIFDADELAKEVLGPVMHDSYSRYKHDEWDRFSVTITEWEREEYLRFY